MMPTVAILAGGKATRLYPVTLEMPKAMLQVAGKPFISHQLEMLKNNGVQHVVVCVGYLGEMIKNYIQAGSDCGLAVDFSFDGDKLLGTAGTIRKALPLLGNNFAVMYGDSYLTEDFRPIAKFFTDSNKDGLMTVYKNAGKWDTSNIIYADGKVIKYDKKNIVPEMQYIDYGLLFFKSNAFSAIIDNQVYDLADLCVDLINADQMAGYEVKQRFYEIGSFRGLEETEQYLKNRKE